MNLLRNKSIAESSALNKQNRENSLSEYLTV